MTTRAKQVLLSPVDIDDADFDSLQPPVDPKLEAENEEFDKFRSEMHDSDNQARIFVSRKRLDSRGQPIGKKLFHCFECGIDDHTFSQLVARIRDDYGTGLYQIQGRDSNGRFKFSKVIGVEAPKTDEDAPKGDSMGEVINQFSHALERNQERTEMMVREMAGNRGGFDVNNFVAIMGAVTPLLTPLIGKLFEKPESKSIVEQLTEIKLMQDTLGLGNDSEGGEANLYSLLGKTVEAFGAPIAQALTAASESDQLDDDGVLRPRLEAPKPENAQEASNMAEDMKQQIGFLINNAKAGTPPKQFAEFLCDTLPDENLDQFFEFISAPDAVAKLITIEPAAREHQQWLDDVRAHVLEILVPDDEDGTKDLQADDDGNIIGDDPDAVVGAGTDDRPNEPDKDRTDSSDTASDSERVSRDQSDAEDHGEAGASVSQEHPTS